jgi:hypothetical protein
MRACETNHVKLSSHVTRLVYCHCRPWTTYTNGEKFNLIQVPYQADTVIGCIPANNHNGKAAVFCYGHTIIAAERETELAEKFNIIAWQRPAEEDDRPVAQRQRLCAIIKALMHDQTPFNAKMIPEMKKDFTALRRMFVYVRDVRADNYRGGKLVDLAAPGRRRIFLC